MVAPWYKPIDDTRDVSLQVYRLINLAHDTRAHPLCGSYLGCPRLDDDAEARVCKLADAPRQMIRGACRGAL